MVTRRRLPAALLPAALLAAAAALYWLMALAVLRVVVPVRLQSEFPADDGCGGSCTVYMSLSEMLEPLGLAAAAAALVAAALVAAALVAAALGPRLRAHLAGRPASAWWLGAWITSGAFVLAWLAAVIDASVRGPAVGVESLAGLWMASPLLLTALPFGMGAARAWYRLTPGTDGGPAA